MAKVKIDLLGIKRYFNDDGQLNREDGPAIISPFGTRHWYSNDVIIRYISSSGMNIFYDDAPRPSTSPNGGKYWHIRGQEVWPEFT